MVRYFINFEDYIEVNNNIDYINLFNKNIFIKKKTKSGLYRFESIIYFKDNKTEFMDTIKKYDNIMIELREEDLKKYNKLLIKKYNMINADLYKEQSYNDEKSIRLINYKALIDMNVDEISKGDIILLETCIDDNRYLNLNFNIRTLFSKGNIKEIRRNLISKNIFSDIYFYTEKEYLLEKYENYITEICEVQCNKYEVINNKFYVIDSLKNSDLVGLSSSNFLYLDIISENSVPLYVIKNDVDYSIKLNDVYHGKKGYYITNPEINKLLNKKEMLPLLKYINMYEFVDGRYKKYPVSKDLEEKNILKYQRVNKRK